MPIATGAAPRSRPPATAVAGPVIVRTPWRSHQSDPWLTAPVLPQAAWRQLRVAHRIGDVGPFRALGLRCSQAMSVHQAQQYLVPEPLPTDPACRIDHSIGLVGPEVISPNMRTFRSAEAAPGRGAVADRASRPHQPTRPSGVGGQAHQVGRLRDLTPGSGPKTFHVRQLKGSIDSVHTLDRDEVSALRKLKAISTSPSRSSQSVAGRYRPT